MIRRGNRLHILFTLCFASHESKPAPLRSRPAAYKKRKTQVQGLISNKKSQDQKNDKYEKFYKHNGVAHRPSFYENQDGLHLVPNYKTTQTKQWNHEMKTLKILVLLSTKLLANENLLSISK